MKTILITGANRGIGRGLARHYLARGWKVLGTARAPAESFQSLETEFPSRFFPVELDVADESSVSRLAENCAGHTLDRVVCNAGISPDENLGSWTAAVFEKSFAVNAAGPALVAQALLPLMNEGAKLVNMSSGMGSIEININPEGGLDAYAMSKAALNMLSHRLAEKLRPENITVVAMSPGWVQTEMGGPEAPTPVEEAVPVIATTIEGFSMEHSGGFFSETGEPLPW